jgi:biopolymer transport protein ExbD
MELLASRRVKIGRAIMRLTLRILLVATAVLIFGLRVSKKLTSRPSGFYVEMVAHTSSSECEDYSNIVLQISKEHTFRINSETVLSENLKGRLREIFRPRAERVLLVRADPDVSFQKVVGAIDIAEGAVTNLHVALLTPEAEKEPCWGIKSPPPWCGWQTVGSAPDENRFAGS